MSCDPTLLAVSALFFGDELPEIRVYLHCKRFEKTHERLKKRKIHRKNRRNGFPRSFYDVFR